MRPLAVLVLCAVLGFVAYLLLQPTPRGVGVAREPGRTTPDVERPAAATPTPVTAPGLSATGTAVPKPVAGPRVVGGVVRDQGTVRIVLTLPDGVEPGVGVRFDIAAKGPALATYPLPVREEDGTWRYETLPVGVYRVRVVVEGMQAASPDATVRADEETVVPVTLMRGGAIAYRAVLYSGEAPETVKLGLADARGVPVVSSIQLPAAMVHVGVDAATWNLDLPPEGRIVGLKPGAYRLRATAASGEFDEQTVDVTVGEPAAVELKIRK